MCGVVCQDGPGGSLATVTAAVFRAALSVVLGVAFAPCFVVAGFPCRARALAGVLVDSLVSDGYRGPYSVLVLRELVQEFQEE